MTAPIRQSVRFNASPAVPYDIYMDSNKHSAATGAPARISRKVGGRFTAWGSALSGHNLLLVPDKIIVQARRSVMFKKSDPDSILVLQFTKAASGCRVNLVHVNVPPQDHRGVTAGWPKYYWKPWKKYLAKR